jgi:hypothetical protein
MFEEGTEDIISALKKDLRKARHEGMNDFLESRATNKDRDWDWLLIGF